jgi:hypothetical protein
VNKIPELWELRPLLRTIILTEPIVVAKSISVILDNGQQADEIDEQLRTLGVVVTILPLVSGKSRDQSTKILIGDVELVVEAKVNPVKNATGAQVDLEELLSGIIKTITQYPRHKGGEVFKSGKDSLFALDDFSDRLFAYKIFFTKEVTP